MPTTIGSYGDAGGWCAVAVMELQGKPLLVELRQREPDDPEARCLVLRRYRAGERERAEAEGAARVLALGGQLGCEPEQLACSPVVGRARRELRPRAAERRLAQARRQGLAAGRAGAGATHVRRRARAYLHVVGPALRR